MWKWLLVVVLVLGVAFYVFLLKKFDTTTPEYHWVKVTDHANFLPRDGAGALVYRDSLYLIGGWNPYDTIYFPRTCSNDVWSSKDGNSWKLVKRNSFANKDFNPNSDWEGRHTAGYVVFDGKMWIVGGDLSQNHYQFGVWNSTNGKDWVRVNKDKPVPWGPRVLHITATFKDKIWVIGGQTLPQFAESEEKLFNDIWNSSDGITWTKVEIAGDQFKPRGAICGSVVFKDRLWIIGGGTYDTPSSPERVCYSDVWSTADGVNWKCHTENAGWRPREYHNVITFDGKMWVLGGASTGKENYNDVWYSDDGENWKELKNTPWLPRHAASVFVSQENIVFTSGSVREDKRKGSRLVNDVWKLVRNKPQFVTESKATTK